MTWYIGVDPGKSGAIAIVRDTEAHTFLTQDYGQVTEAFATLAGLRYPTYPVAAVEKVHAFPGQGVVSAFTFGTALGSAVQGLSDAGFTWLEVVPRVWQRVFSLPTREEAGGYSEKKRAHAAYARDLFPRVKVTHAVADALLIARWHQMQTEAR